jgi:hypothetical protein
MRVGQRLWHLEAEEVGLVLVSGHTVNAVRGGYSGSLHP